LKGRFGNVVSVGSSMPQFLVTGGHYPSELNGAAGSLILREKVLPLDFCGVRRATERAQHWIHA